MVYNVSNERLIVGANATCAYPVKKQADGNYVLINFEADPEVIKEIDRVMKIQDDILKHLIVKIDE